MSSALTAKGAATRQRMIDGAALLVREQGAAETNLDDVLSATATSKSQLFHYFPAGRTELLAAVADREAQQVLDAQRPYLDDLSGWPVWLEWQSAVLNHYLELGERCPLGALTAELGKSSPEARAVVSRLFETWESALLLGVERTRPELDVQHAADLARSILAAIQGGVGLLRATGRIDYLESALAASLEPLRS